MAAATKLPTRTELVTSTWSRPDGENPRLARALTASATTIYFTVAPKKEDSTLITGGFLMGVKNADNVTEQIWVPASAVAVDGLSATGCVRGIDISGLDYTAASGISGYAMAHEEGEPIFFVISALIENLVRAALQGEIATGSASLNLGTGASEAIDVKANGVSWLRKTAAGVAQYWNGSAFVNFVDSTASVIAKVSAADTTPDYLYNKIDVATDGELTKAIGSPAGDEKIQLGLATTLTKAEMDALHTGISANVTGTNLATLTAGAASNADALHTHTGLGFYSYMAYEAISAEDAVCLLPIQVEYFSQLTEANLALGDSNVRRKHAIKIVPGVTSSTLTTMVFRAAEAVNGATTLGNLTISIQTDSAGAPSGTAVANGTANVITQATQRTWNTTKAPQTATWAASPTLTAGTTYWLVFEVAATDVTNYLNISVNSSHDENYLTFTRLTYNLDTLTWGTSTTNATPFFQFDDQVNLLGFALAQTDANWGGRTWNFIGFAPSAISALATGSVGTFTATFASKVQGATYYLSATPGQITETAPFAIYSDTTEPTAFTYQIGKAVSTTKLNISTGTKRVLTATNAAIQATTDRAYVLWFKPSFIRITATGGAANTGCTSVGFVGPDASDYCTYMQQDQGGTNIAGAASLTASLFTTNAAGTSGFSGAASAFTKAGFNYTFTETGTGTVYALMEVLA